MKLFIGITLLLVATGAFAAVVQPYAVPNLKKFSAKYDPYKKYQNLLPKLADMQSRQSGCTSVEGVGPSIDRSTPNNPVFFAACKDGNGNLYNTYYSKSDIQAGSSKEKARPVTESRAITLCQEAVTRQASYPSTVSRGLFGTTTNTFPNSNVRVDMEFEAKNALGNALPYIAKCLVKPDESIEVKISRR